MTMQFGIAQICLIIFLGWSYAHASSIDLDCDFKYEEFAVVRSQYTCSVKNVLTISERNIIIKEVHGTHIENYNATLVTALSIENGTINFIPSNLGEKFPNLVALRIKNGKLNELNQDDLKDLPKLKYLNLDDNSIKVLDDGLFDFNQDLQLAWFKGNNLRKIGSTVFRAVENLSSLDLTGNPCINKKFQELSLTHTDDVNMTKRLSNFDILAEITVNCTGLNIESKIDSEEKIDLSTDILFDNLGKDLQSRLLDELKTKKIPSAEILKLNKIVELLKNDSSQQEKDRIRISNLEAELKTQKEENNKIEAELNSTKMDITKINSDLLRAQETIKNFEHENATSSEKLLEIENLRGKIVELERKLTTMNSIEEPNFTTTSEKAVETTEYKLDTTTTVENYDKPEGRKTLVNLTLLSENEQVGKETQTVAYEIENETVGNNEDYYG